MLYGRRSTLGVIQDLHLTVAAKIAGIQIDEHFYESTHKPGTYARLTTWQIRRQQSLSAASTREVSLSASISQAGSQSSSTQSVPTNFMDFRATLAPPLLPSQSMCKVLPYLT